MPSWSLIAWRVTTSVLVAAFVLACCAVHGVAAPSVEQRTKLKSVESQIKKAGNQYKAKKYSEAAESVKEAQATLAEVLGDKDAAEVTRMVTPLHKQLTKAHDLLKQKGVELPPLPPFDPTGKKTGTVSFAKQVVPLLVAKCGNCHVRATRGGFSMATFDTLSKGPPEGIVVRPGSSMGSRLVEVIETGDMPRGGAKVSDTELTLLKTWIDEGAKFDGQDPLARLTAPGNAAGDEPARVMAVKATGNEEVQFARDLGSVVLQNCTGCHGERNPRAQLSMVSFNRLLAGGQSGAPISPGKPSESLFLRKIKGMAGDRMPLGRPPLSDEVIAKFEKWIATGARFDGPNPDQPLSEAVAVVAANNSTHEQLTEQRATAAAETWRLILPDSKPRTFETKNFLIYGNVADETLQEVGKLAESQVPTLSKLFKIPPDQPLVKGRMTLFVFAKRYDYGEVGTMLDRRELPIEWKGHWRYNVVDAQGFILPPGKGEYSLASVVAQQIVGVYVASQGSVPRWFAEGSARAMAAKVDGKDPRVRAWESKIAEALSLGGKPDAFLSAGLPPEETDVLSYSFAKFLMSKAVPYQQLLAELRSGTPFNEAFMRVYGATPNQLATVWAPKAVARRGR